MSRTMVNSRIRFMRIIIATSCRTKAWLQSPFWGTHFCAEPTSLRESVHFVDGAAATLLPGAKKENQCDKQVSKVEVGQPGIGRSRNRIKSSCQGHHHRDAGQN